MKGGDLTPSLSKDDAKADDPAKVAVARFVPNFLQFFGRVYPLAGKGFCRKPQFFQWRVSDVSTCHGPTKETSRDGKSVIRLFRSFVKFVDDRGEMMGLDFGEGFALA